MFPKMAIWAWWIMAVSYPALVAFSIMGWNGGYRVGIEAASGPDDKMIITSARPGSNAWQLGARSGDVLLELDGVAVTRETWQKTGDSGDSVKILSLSDQEVIESSVSLENNPGVPLITSLFIVSLVFALSSFFVFYRANHTPQTLALSVLFVVMALAFAAAPAGARQLNWATDILQYALMGSAAMFFAFFSSFTLAPERVRKQNFVIRPLLVGMAVWTVAVGMLYVVSVYFLPEIFDAVRKVKLSQIGVGFLGGVIFLIIGYFGNSSPPEKEQLRIMAFGATATVIPFVLLSVAPDVVGLPAIINAETIVPTIVIIPLAFGYAILRHHLMGIRRLVHRGAAYTLMSFVAVVIYGGLIAVVRAAGGDELSNSTTLQILLLIILFVAIPLISGSRRLAFATVDRLLYRDFVDHANLSRRVSVEAANSQHFDDLARTVLRTMVTELQLMHAEFVRVWHNRSVVVASEGQAPDNFSQAVGAVLNGNKVPSAISVDSYKLDENGQTMIINLNQEPDGRLLMCLGPKITEEPFQPEDLELAQTVANHIATVIEKLELFDELQNKASELTELNRRLVDTQETERARIASYLHDDALAQISNMVWRYDEDDFPPGALDDLQAISTGLREISTSLHPGVLEELGLAPALEYLGNEAARLAGFHFKLHHGTITEDLTLDQETRLALYRIAQEALNNCQQHSRADNVWIHLALREDEIEMTVEDDGVGLPIEAPADKNVRLGLVGMRERATQARGQFKLLKNQPTGTTVLVCLPIHHNSEQTSP